MNATIQDVVGSVAGLGAVTALNTLASGSFEGDEDFYNSLKQPKWAPPDWAFAPVWAVNNLLNVYADIRVARSKNPRGKKAFAMTQGVFWTAFFGFGAVYFRKKSPVLGFIATATGAAAAVVSTAVAARVIDDKKAALALTPTALWTLFATAVSGKIAFDNVSKDPYFGALESSGYLRNACLFVTFE